jgi:hypothetical protein
MAKRYVSHTLSIGLGSNYVYLSRSEATKDNQNELQEIGSKGPKAHWYGSHRTGPVVHRTI